MSDDLLVYEAETALEAGARAGASSGRSIRNSNAVSNQQIEKTPEADAGFAGILSCFALRLHDELERLADPNAKLSVKAWACRNLLEAHIQIKFALFSGENAKSYSDDAWVDLVQLLEAFRLWVPILGKKLVHYLDEFGLTTKETELHQALDDSLKRLNEAKVAAGVPKPSYTSTATMAEQVGLKDEYKYVSKFASKLVHPTAHSVLVGADWMPRVLPNIDEILIDAGSIHCVEALRLIEKHITRDGLFPPGNKSKEA